LDRTGSNLFLQYGAVLVLTAVLFGISCAPGLLWQDSGLIQYRVINNDIEGFLGLAISHPLFYLLAICTKAVTFVRVPYAANMLSAMAAAVAVANLFLLVRLLTGKSLSATLAALALALSHTFWQHASMAETYTLWSALFTAELVVLLQYTRTNRMGYLYLLGLLNGLALAVHMLAIISLTVYIIYVVLLWRRRSIACKNIGIMVLLWMVGCLPYEYLIIKNIIVSGDIIGTFSSALFGNQWKEEVLNASITARLILENLMLWVLNFPTPNAILAIIGLFELTRAFKRNAFGWMIMALSFLFLVFAFRYTVADRYAFFIPFYCMVSILIGLGAGSVLARFPHRWLAGAMILAALLPVAFYSLAPEFARKAGVEIRTRGDVPYRDDLHFFLTPWKTGYTGAERFAMEALATADPNAIIYADLTTVGPLLVTQQITASRSDVSILSPAVHTRGAPQLNAQTLPGLLQTRPVYVVSRKKGYCPAFVLADYDLVSAGFLWQVKPRITEKAGTILEG
jgi:hypothetical protein